MTLLQEVLNTTMPMGQAPGHGIEKSPSGKEPLIPQEAGKANSLKRGVVGELKNSLIQKSIHDTFGQFLPLGQVVDTNEAAIHGHADEENLEPGILRITINPCLVQIHRRKRLDVDMNLMHQTASGIALLSTCSANKSAIAAVNAPSLLIPRNSRALSQISL